MTIDIERARAMVIIKTDQNPIHDASRAWTRIRIRRTLVAKRFVFRDGDDDDDDDDDDDA